MENAVLNPSKSFLALKKSLITSPKKTLVKYTYPAPRFPLCPIIFSLDQPQPPTGDCGT